MKRSPVDQIELMRNILAFALVGAFVGALLRFSFKDVPTANKDILTYMVGQLSGMATTCLGFYFVNKVGQDALDAKRSENTGKAFEAVTTALKTTETGTPEEAAAEAADATADAAVDKAAEIKGK